MTSGQKMRMHSILNGLGSEVQETVGYLAEEIGTEVPTSSAELELDVQRFADSLDKVADDSERREVLVRLVAHASLLLVIDEVKRGSKAIEREMAEFHSKTKPIRQKAA